MKVRVLILVLMVMTQCVFLLAGEVQIMAALPDDVYSISKDAKREWNVNDRICFRPLTHKGGEIDYRDILACGQVLDVLEEDFLVHVTSRNTKLPTGAKVKAWRPGGKTYQRNAEFAKRTISSLPDPLTYRVMSIGAQFLAPFIHLEQGIAQHFSLGFQPSFLKADVGLGSIQGFGFHLTTGYHFTELFEGPWVLVGTGIMMYTGMVNGNGFRKDSLSVHGSIGYRLWFFDTFSLAVSAGGQYVVNHTFPQFILAWNGFLPVALLQVGIKF